MSGGGGSGGGREPGEREVVFSCGRCGAAATCRAGYREGIVVLCPECGAEVTRDFRRAYFAGVSAEIHARLVERDNRAFLDYLGGAWRGGEEPKGGG